MMTPAQIWQATLGELRLQLTKSNFMTWLADTRLRSFNAATNEFTIEVSDEFAKNWLDKRLASAIRRTLTGICGCPTSAIFIVNTDEAPHQADIDEPAHLYNPNWADFGIPLIFRDESFDTLDWSRPVLQKPELREYIDHAPDYSNIGMGLNLIGPPGTGKTHVAVALLKLAVLAGYSARFIGAGQLLDQLRATFDPSRQGGLAQTESRILRDLIEVQFLVLDDLRVDGLTVWGRDRLYALLNPRWEALRPTIVTSNFTPNEIPFELKRRLLTVLVDTILVDSVKREFTIQGEIKGTYGIDDDSEPNSRKNNGNGYGGIPETSSRKSRSPTPVRAAFRASAQCRDFQPGLIADQTLWRARSRAYPSLWTHDGLRRLSDR
jgi:hypothetical protein